jgi:hypothetical protein
MKSESKKNKRKNRITHEVNLDDDVSEIVVYEYSENEIIPSNIGSSNSDDETFVHIAVNSPDSSPNYHPPSVNFQCECRHKCASLVL